MLLSLRDAATLMNCPPRTLRGRLARGEIPGRKIGGQWKIRRADLPLTPTERRAAQDRIAEMRDAVEAAVPASLRARIGAGHLDELDVFVDGRAILNDMTADATGGDDREPAGALRGALLSIAEGHYQFDRRVKLAAFTDARAGIGRAVASLLLDDLPPQSPRARWARRLEVDVLPRLAGLIRWAEALPDRSRRSTPGAGRAP